MQPESLTLGSRHVRALNYAVAAVGAAAILLLAFILARQGLWNSAEGLRVLQIDNIMRQGLDALSLQYPLRAFDPDFRSIGIPPQSLVIRGERIFANAPPAFAYAVVLLGRITGGEVAWRAIPLASIIGILAVVFMLARRNAHAGLIAVTAVFATPILPYAFTGSGTAPALFFGLLSYAVLQRAAESGRIWQSVLAAVFAGIAALFAEEFALWAAAIGVFAQDGKRIRFSFAAVLIGCIVAIIAINIATAGVSFYAAAGIKPWLRSRPYVAYRTLLAGTGSLFADLLLAYFLFSLAIAPLMRPAIRPAVLLAGLASALAIRFFLWNRAEPLQSQAQLGGMITAAPFLLLGFAADGKRFAMLAIFYALAVVLLAPGSSLQPIHWGPRLMLVLLPLLVVGLPIAIPRLLAGLARSFRLAVAVLLAIAVLMGIADNYFYLQNFGLKKRVSAGTWELVAAADPLPIITDLPWLAEECATLYHRRPILAAFAGRDAAKSAAIARRISPDGAVLLTSGVPPNELQNAGSITPLTDIGTVNFPDQQFSYQSFLLRWK